jgi:hypothetical protein
MLQPCWQNPALLAFQAALKGSYAFNATTMAPLGTKVLAHHKPNQQLSRGFHTLIAWYISPSLQHYQCIKIIMRNTGGERITNIFRYKHQTIAVSEVTATDCILEATQGLAVAIEGIQEAALDELQAIKSLQHILLGEQIPQQPHPPPPTPLHDSNVDKEPIHMWDLTIHAQPILPSDATPQAPQTGCAIIDNDDDTPTPPIPAVHNPRPAIIQDNDDAPPIAKHPWTHAQQRT